MAMTFRCPQGEVTFPNAEINDEQALVQTIDLTRALNGTPYSYVKTSNRRLLTFNVVMSLMKGIELQEFLTANNARRMTFIDHLDRRWIGYILTNPIEFSTPNRSNNWPGGEAVAVQLEFEGVLQS